MAQIKDVIVTNSHCYMAVRDQLHVHVSPGGTGAKWDGNGTLRMVANYGPILIVYYLNSRGRIFLRST